MEEKLFDLVKQFGDSIGLNINFYYSSISDNIIEIGFKTTRQSHIQEYGSPFIRVADVDRTKAFAKAYDKLTDWLSENNGGY